ncbi:thioredoxin domain-containing protein [Acidianus brierleyi]|uniref:Thioredoxin domain-containing protein n=1 Tax=Acidianus brierleyi TaxID=41673 RepID=A0A2U9IBX4_9CREN|nr:thioredoxin domain-containing protein [Acidianus brierleyi]AWR93521.1 DUF255 domain-containing protein [Acidianus brierleyi]
MNKLANSKSAFLRESINSPINWYEWTEEAFEIAKNENKPIIVDVGASWCHWCHVMDKSYEDPDVVKIINENFIAIKVDRDEKPDLDKSLQNAVFAISGESGWPLTVFMTPDKKVFYGGTYFPPDDFYGRIGFKKLLREILNIWKNERDKINSSSISIIRHFNIEEGNTKLDFDLISSSYSAIVGAYDIEYGGIGNSMKFPHPKIDEFLLAYSAWTGDDLGKKLSLYTLKKMYYGGIFDQVGGGFHRYTVDREWLVPHFEKLLIDNAELILDYFNEYIALNDPEILDALDLSVDFVLRDLYLGEGFANSIDADSDGIEGGYYTWTENEFDEALGQKSKEAKKIFGFYQLGGEVEGRKVLRLAYDMRDISKFLNLSINETISFLRNIRDELLKYRLNSRKMPNIDDNKYTYSNCRIAESLVLSSMVSGKGLNEGLNIVNKLQKISRRLEGGQDGLIEDYASALNASIVAYEVTSQHKYLDMAIDIFNSLQKFRANDIFIDSQGDIPKNDIPNESAISLLLKGMYKLELMGYTNVSNTLKSSISDSDDPSFTAGMLLTLGSYIKGGAHIIIIDEKDGNANKLHKEAILTYYPFKAVEKVSIDDKDYVNSLIRSMMRESEGKSRAFICIGNTCSLPIFEEKDVKRLLITKL